MGEKCSECAEDASKVICASYKGKDYKAWVRTNGGIRFKGETYDSPSGAGKAIRKKETDGWRFWKYKDTKGNLVAFVGLDSGGDEKTRRQGGKS